MQPPGLRICRPAALTSAIGGGAQRIQAIMEQICATPYETASEVLRACGALDESLLRAYDIAWHVSLLEAPEVGSAVDNRWALGRVLLR